MNFRLDSSILEAFKQLDALHEDNLAAREASKKFWAAAKAKQIDERAFHAAYDEELAGLGLSDIFDAKGKLANRGVYAKIKEAKNTNPDSWAVKAAAKLWALAYIDSASYQVDIEERQAALEKTQKEAEIERAKKEAILQEASKSLAHAIEQVSSDALSRYAQYTDKDIRHTCTIKEYKSYSRQFTNCDYAIHIDGCPYIYPLSEEDVFSTDALVARITKGIAAAVDNIRKQTNNKIDVFSTSARRADASCKCRCILLGESGKLYFIYKNSNGTITVSLAGFLQKPYEDIKYLGDIPETYKVIFTDVTESDDNQVTYRNSTSYTYYSWDSSAADKIRKYIPKLGESTGVWSESSTIAVNSPYNDFYSKMDNIDSWAERKHTAFSTD